MIEKGFSWFMSSDGKRAVVETEIGLCCFIGGVCDRRFTGQRVGVAVGFDDARRFLEDERVSLLRHPKVPPSFSEALPTLN